MVSLQGETFGFKNAGIAIWLGVLIVWVLFSILATGGVGQVLNFVIVYVFGSFVPVLIGLILNRVRPKTKAAKGIGNIS